MGGRMMSRSLRPPTRIFKGHRDALKELSHICSSDGLNNTYSLKVISLKQLLGCRNGGQNAYSKEGWG